jgi:hypothetical protein
MCHSAIEILFDEMKLGNLNYAEPHGHSVYGAQ